MVDCRGKGRWNLSPRDFTADKSYLALIGSVPSYQHPFVRHLGLVLAEALEVEILGFSNSVSRLAVLL
jgi:hypothetical protein